jgi:serine/threonine protein kinase
MFSLGATAYELASASRLPETGPDYAAIRASPRAPPSLPPELGALIKALMDPDPNRRPTAGQVLDNEALNSMVLLSGPEPLARAKP